MRPGATSSSALPTPVVAVVVVVVVTVVVAAFTVAVTFATNNIPLASAHEIAHERKATRGGRLLSGAGGCGGGCGRGRGRRCRLPVRRSDSSGLLTIR